MAKNSLAKLIPKSITIEVDGKTIVIAGNAEENRVLNYLLASKIRGIIDMTLEKYANLDETITPRELRDIAEAGKAIAEFSATVYKDADPIAKPEKQVESEAIDFDTLKKDDNPASKGSP